MSEQKLTEAETEHLWRHVKIAPSPHDREQIEAAAASIAATRTDTMRSTLAIVDSLTTAAEYRAQTSLSRDFAGNLPVGMVPAPDLRSALNKEATPPATDRPADGRDGGPSDG